MPTPQKTEKPVAAAQYGEVLEIPLNLLKASPENVRRSGWTQEAVETMAASVGAKGVLQPLVVKAEVGADGEPTGAYLVSAGERRRQALRLLAKRKRLARTVPVRCVLDTRNDAVEVSLDENVTREPMHPADAFEAFRDLADRHGWGAEEIGARFGVKPEIVRQRLRLGAVAPALLDVYREGGLTLDQLMAFAVNPDVERQVQVYGQLADYQRSTHTIRRAMLEARVSPQDKRVLFVGLAAYAQAGGPVLYDLFTEAGEGYVEDVALLDRLVLEKLNATAEDVRAREGWKWAEGFVDYPHGHGFGRVYEKPLQRPPGTQIKIDGLYAERDGLIERFPDLADMPEATEARLQAIDQELDALGDDYGYDPAEKAYSGVVVVVSHEGEARIERGFVRPEDIPVVPEAEDEDGETGDGERAGEDEAAEAERDDDADELVGDPAAPLSARLRADLTAHRSAALRCALADHPALALIGVLHALVCRVFGATSAIPTCLDIRIYPHDLNADGEGIEDSRAGIANAERHETWARQMPETAADLWDFLVGLDGDSRISLLAHCVGLALNGVHGWERRPGPWAHADQLAQALDLDMADWWSPTAARYLDGVTKAHILAAVGEAVSPDAADRLAKLKKGEMVEAAEPQLVAARWLPSLLRTPGHLAPQADDGAGAASGQGAEMAQAELGALEPVAAE